MSTLPRHIWQAFDTPWAGVHGMHIDSARHYGRHWHDTFGVGPLEHGAQTSTRGRGSVDAYAGDLITCNPGEVHDGRPLGGPSRRWRILSFEPSAMAELSFNAIRAGATTIEITQPAIRDAELRAAFSTLFGCIDRWRPARSATDSLACDEALADTLQLLTARYTTTPPDDAVDGDMKRVRDRLADEVAEPPTLAALAAMTGMSPYQVLRRFKAAYGMPPHAWLLQQRAERARKLIQSGVSVAHSGGMQWLCRSEPPLAHFHASVRLHAGRVATCDAVARMSLLTASASR